MALAFCIQGLLRGGGGGQVVGHAGSSPGSRGVRALLDGSTRGGNGDALLSVELLNVEVGGDAGIAGDDLLGAGVQRGAHDGTFGGALGEAGEGGEAGRVGGGERAQRGLLGAAEKGAGRLEAGQGRKLVHGRKSTLELPPRSFQCIALPFREQPIGSRLLHPPATCPPFSTRAAPCPRIYPRSLLLPSQLPFVLEYALFHHPQQRSRRPKRAIPGDISHFCCRASTP